MPFQFSFLGDLLSELEDHVTRNPPHLPARVKVLYRDTITRWFWKHRELIDGNDTDDVALLSTLFPERRTDRVFNLREAGLAKEVARSLGLGSTRVQKLNLWRQKGRGDLGQCVQKILEDTPNARQSETHQVTVEEIDQALARIAKRSRFSGPLVRANASNDAADTFEKLLRNIFLHLRARDAKWLVRMILKDYTPVILPERLVLKLFHFLLPDLLRLHSSFDAVVSLLRSHVFEGWPSKEPNQTVKGILMEKAASHLVPKLGIKVGRVPFIKARSIKHCLNMVGTRRMSLERKYDGEYCQIHIDLKAGDRWIQIFSKSGKDSTNDRKAIRDTIHKCLGIGKRFCKITAKCILEGELVVFSDKDNEILEFHKLRKHLTRSGTHLGTEQDSPPHDFERLMIVFYDILLIDNDNILAKPYSERRHRMKHVLTRIPGRAELVKREEIDFSKPSGAESLRDFFAHGITRRWEGFILKCCEDPYFSFNKTDYTGEYSGCWIKLKKDYIQGLGDTADFAVVGASYNAKEAQTLGLNNLSWTTFHLGCMENKEEVVRLGAKPMFRIVDALNQSINEHDIKTLNQLGQFQAIKYGCEAVKEVFHIRAESHPHCMMDVVFREPFVFEISGFGFDKNPNTAYFVPRFPRVRKIHWDRDYKETISFNELQDMADEARTAPAEEQVSQEEAEWVEKLKRADLTSAERKALTRTLALPPFDHSQASNSSKRRSSQRSSQNPPPPLVRIDTSEVFGHESRSTTPATEAHSSSTASLMTPPTSSAPGSGNDSSLSVDTQRSMSLPSKAPPKRKATDAFGLSSITRRAKKPNIGRVPVPSLPPPARESLPAAAPVISTSFKPHPKPLADVTNTSPTRVRRAPIIIMEDTGKEKAYTSLNQQRPNTSASDMQESIPALKQPEQQAQTRLAASPLANQGFKLDTEITSENIQQQRVSGNSINEQLSKSQASTSNNEIVQRVFKNVFAGPPRCHRSLNGCALANVTILLSPDVAPFPYVTRDLLPKHSVPSVTDITLWDCARGAVAGIHGKQKMVLVESRAAYSTASIVHEILNLDLNEKILFYDWRLLEELAEREQRNEDDGIVEWCKKHFTALVESCDDREGERRMVGMEALEGGRWEFWRRGGVNA